MLLSASACVRAAIALYAAALLIFALGHYTNVDLDLADAMYDGAARAFPWRDAWLTDTFSHRILKALLTVPAGLFIGTAAVDAAWPQARFDRPLARLRLHAVAVCAVAVPLAISLLKQQSSAHCPWDLARYGGSQPYVRLFDLLPAGVAPGHCLPAGHASSALWLLSLAVFWLPEHRRAARRAALAAMGLGLAVGWMQQMRGAHFLTHTLWSAWIACAIVLAVVMLLQARAGRKAAVSGDTPLRVPAGTRCRAR